MSLRAYDISQSSEALSNQPKVLGQLPAASQKSGPFFASTANIEPKPRNNINISLFKKTTKSINSTSEKLKHIKKWKKISST
jgi:hypothetical protein